MLKGIERASGGSLQISRTRQLTFNYKGHRFKANFEHQLGFRGGIQIIEVLPGRGAPEGGVALEVATLDEAEAAYLHLEVELDKFLGI